MKLGEYFEQTKGIGVLSTADAAGKVDAALYARPHELEDGTLAFVMRDRLSHHNLQSNPQAIYLFIEEGPGYKGKRLCLSKVREEQDSELLDKMCRRVCPVDEKASEARFLVAFRVDEERPLVGAE